MPFQGVHLLGRPFAACHLGENIELSHQHDSVACSILADHMEHRVEQLIVLNVRDYRYDPFLAQPHSGRQIKWLQFTERGASRSITLIAV